jgi:hypothetical protein
MDVELPLVDDPDVEGRDEASEAEEPVGEGPKNDVPDEDEDDVAALEARAVC